MFTGKLGLFGLHSTYITATNFLLFEFASGLFDWKVVLKKTYSSIKKNTG